MSENWQPGDVALYVDDTPYHGSETPWELRAGQKYTVLRAGIYRFAGPSVAHGLELLEIKRPFKHSAFGSYRFDKQPPLVKEDEVTEELEMDNAKVAGV